MSGPCWQKWRYSAACAESAEEATGLYEQLVENTPCTNLEKTVDDSGFVHRLNLTYEPNEDLLFYTTWSKGLPPPQRLEKIGSCVPMIMCSSWLRRLNSKRTVSGATTTARATSP